MYCVGEEGEVIGEDVFLAPSGGWEVSWLVPEGSDWWWGGGGVTEARLECGRCVEWWLLVGFRGKVYNSVFKGGGYCRCDGGDCDAFVVVELL